MSSGLARSRLHVSQSSSDLSATNVAVPGYAGSVSCGRLFSLQCPIYFPRCNVDFVAREKISETCEGRGKHDLPRGRIALVRVARFLNQEDEEREQKKARPDMISSHVFLSAHLSFPIFRKY